MARQHQQRERRDYTQLNAQQTKLVGTALAVIDSKLGSGAATKYNAVKLDDKLKWQTEKVYVRQIFERSPKLAEALLNNPVSLMAALQTAAQLGLTLDPNQQLAYLVPQAPRRGAPAEVVLRVSYRGMEQAVLMSGTVTAIQTELVHENDEFEYGVNIDGPYLNFKLARGDRGEVTGGFCLARYANGEKHVEYMDLADLLAIEASAKAFSGDNSPAWDGPYRPEMRKKSIVRRAQKHWPKSPVLTALARAFDIENPMDFDKPVLSGEAVEVFGDPEIKQLEKLLEPLEPTLRAEWMQRMAEALNYGSITEVPRERFTEVLDRLDHRLKLWLKNHAPTPAPAEEPTHE